MTSCANFNDTNKNETKDLQIESYELSSRSARSLILHLLYAMDAFDYDCSLESIVDNFNRGFDLAIPIDSQVASVAQAIITHRDQLDQEIKPLLHNWRFDRIGLCTKLILRFALWELSNSTTVANIVINEAIELAKCFAERDAYKFVNGILDEAVKKMGRQNEIETVQENEPDADSQKE